MSLLRVEDNHLLTDQWVLRITGEFVLRKDYQPKLEDCKECVMAQARSIHMIISLKIDPKCLLN
jgi:hypothetical protein